MTRALAIVLACTCGLLPAATGRAGNIFVTGHDPDFHADGSLGAVDLLQVSLDHVTCDTTNTTTEKFLVVTARPADIGGVPAGHRDPVVHGFNELGLVEGVHFDVANAAAVPAVDFWDYTALAVVSSFGGLLDRPTLDALNARRDDIRDFVGAGGGIFASSECDSGLGIACGANLLDPAPAPKYEFLPIVLTAVPSVAPFTVTPFGSGLGLTDADVNDATHNSFTDAAGLEIVDTDANGNPTTIAGSFVIEPTFPVFPADAADVTDPSDCGLGLLVTWEEAVFTDPALGGVYHVYRSEGVGASCDDALSRPPVASGLTGTRWFDRTTRAGEQYVYVVEAEDAVRRAGCAAMGPNGGATRHACTEPPIVDEGLYAVPDGVDATLRAGHSGQEVTVAWPDARPLLAGETFRLLKATGAPTEAFALVNGTGDVSRSHVETDTSSKRQFFDLRVANACGDWSADDFPPGP